jgi:hypothetical protein
MLSSGFISLNTQVILYWYFVKDFVKSRGCKKHSCRRNNGRDWNRFRLLVRYGYQLQMYEAFFISPALLSRSDTYETASSQQPLTHFAWDI